MEAIVDEDDSDLISEFKWCYSTSNGYASSKKKEQGKTTTLLMHRLILDVPKDMVTDHINGDKLDNRKENLRICTRSENNRNVGPRKTNKSGFKGVYWLASRNKWQVTIRCDRKPHYLGLYENRIDAVLAYNKKAKELFGDFAKLNITEEVDI